MPDLYDLLTARNEYADADMINTVNLAADHVDISLILVDNHELAWEVRSEPALRELERAAGEIGLHLSKRTDSPVRVSPPEDRGVAVWEALHGAGLVPGP